MTISSTASEITYSGNGSTLVFAVPFPFDISADLRVLSTSSTGTVSVLSSGFTVSGGGGSTGSLTFSAAPAAGTSVTVLDDPARTQPTDYAPNDAFSADSHEKALDRVTRLAKRLYQVTQRCLRMADGDPIADLTLETVDNRKGRFLYFDATTGAPAYASASDLATISTYGVANVDTFTGNGSQTAFTLTANPASVNNLFVVLDGATLTPGSDYSYSSPQTLTISPAPADGMGIVVRYLVGLPNSITAASSVTFLQSGTGAVSRTVQSKERDTVSVKDFGAVGDGVTDDTAAFNAAQTAASYIWIPPGSYKVNNLAVASGKRFVGAGPLITKIYQVATGNPSFYVTVPNGSVNWVDIELSGFTGYGITAATVPFVVLTASGAGGALWRSKFDYECTGGYGALTATSSGVNNIFNCSFKIRGDTFTGTAVNVTSGIYNTFELFLTECSGPALVHSGVNAVIDIVCDNQIQDSGLNTHFSRIVIENIVGAALAAGSSAIQLTGTGQTLMNPGVQLPSGSASKVTYAIKPSSLTTIVNPFILSSGGTTLANPFNVNAGVSWTLIGGSSNCTNKMETIYDDSDTAHSLRYVTLIGDVSQLTAYGNTHGGKVIQYSAPSAPFSLNVNGNADAVVLAPTGVMATAQFNLTYGLVDGRVITVSTTQTLTAVTWVSAGTTTNLPSTLAANTTISFVYRAANTTFYRV